MSSVLKNILKVCDNLYNDRYFNHLIRGLINDKNQYVNLLRYVRHNTNNQVFIVNAKNIIIFDSTLEFHNPIIGSVATDEQVQRALMNVYNDYQIPSNLEEIDARKYSIRSGKKSHQYNDVEDYFFVARAVNHNNTFHNIYVINVSSNENHFMMIKKPEEQIIRTKEPEEPREPREPISRPREERRKKKPRTSGVDLLKFPDFSYCAYNCNQMQEACQEETFYFGEECNLDANFA